MLLNVVSYPSAGSATPLLIAHGLFGSARNWQTIASRLSEAGPVYVVDMRNHGHSPFLPSHSYEDLAADLAAVISEVIGERADVLGHSMGGKAAMVLALRHPDLVRRLVVADIAPVVYDDSQRHFITAMRAVNLGNIRRRPEAFQQLFPHVQDETITAFLLQSLDLKSRSWRLNLDVLEQEMGKILGFPEMKTCFEGPSLFLTGEKSDYVVRDHRPKIKTLFAAARFAKIPGAGHWLHSEAPDRFHSVVRVFLGI